MWPNWTNIRDVPRDLLGDVFSNRDQMLKYYEDPSLRSSVTNKDPLTGDFFLSVGICQLGRLLDLEF